MRLIAGKTYVQWDEAVVAGIAEGTLKYQKHYGTTVAFLDDPNDNRRVLIEYETLRPRYRQLIIDKFGTPSEYLSKASIKQHLKHDYHANKFYSDYRLADGTGLPAEHINAYTTAAQWLNMLAEADGAKGFKVKYGCTRSEFYKAAITLISSEHVELPTNYSRLRARLRAYASPLERGEGCVPDYATLISKKFGNDNRNKLNADQLKLLKQLYGRQNNYGYEKTAFDFNTYSLKAEWKDCKGTILTIDPRTAQNYLQQYDRQLKGQRNGNRRWRNQYDLIIPRQRPSHPLFLTCHDGWDVQLLYKREMENKKGAKFTNYWLRKKLIVVIDAFNDYPLGYAICDTESGDGIKQALKNAADHIKELTGSYYLQWQIKSDNFKSNDLKEHCRAIVGNPAMYTPESIGNARDNVIESFFSRFNETYCHTELNWCGVGITGNADNSANREWLGKIKDNFPTEAEHISQLHCLIEAARADKRDEWLAAFNATPQADKRPATREEYLKVFGIRRREFTLTNRMLYPEINGEQNYYMLLENDFMNHAGVKFQLIYDPADLSNLLAINEAERLQFLVPAFEKSKMALKDMGEGDRAYLNKALQFKQQFKEEQIRTNAEELEAVREMILTQTDAETFAKLMPTVDGKQKRFQEQAARMLTAAPQAEASPEEAYSYSPNIYLDAANLNEGQILDYEEQD